MKKANACIPSKLVALSPAVSQASKVSDKKPKAKKRELNSSEDEEEEDSPVKKPNKKIKSTPRSSGIQEISPASRGDVTDMNAQLLGLLGQQMRANAFILYQVTTLNATQNPEVLACQNAAHLSTVEQRTPPTNGAVPTAGVGGMPSK